MMAPLLGTWDASEPAQAMNMDTSLSKSVLYVDAYDSFSYNVVAMLEETLGAKVTVMTIDSDWPDGDMHGFLQHYEAVVLGPGPGDPNLPKDVGVMRDIWNLHETELLPVFGICLGFQSLCLHHGVPIGRLPFPLHGQVRQITTNSSNIFEKLPVVEVTLYHSLFANVDALASPPVDLDFLAWLPLELGVNSRAKIPMAVRHRQKPFWGVQFHPESCKSEKNACEMLLQNWWQEALAFNKASGRGGYGTLPETFITPHDDNNNPFPNIAYEMLKWSSSSIARSSYRSFKQAVINAEEISEVFNKPGSPTVIFQSNGRYSIVSIPSPGSWRLEYSVEMQRLVLFQFHGEKKMIEKTLTVPQLWDSLRYLMEMKRVDSGNPEIPFWGGFLGYFSYEMGLACLPHPKGSAWSHKCKGTTNGVPSNSSDCSPDVSLLWCDRSIVVDNHTGVAIVQSTRELDDSPMNWLDETHKLLQAHTRLADFQELDSFHLNSVLCKAAINFPNESSYKSKIEACKSQLEAGESYELCLTSETSITLPAPPTKEDRAIVPWQLYKRLKKYNPAAFSAFASLGDTNVVSSSPECFLNWDRDSTLEMKPMKGTVRKTPDMTMEKAKKILGTTKEMAENLMIADLIRHDLYGICGSGGVHVEKLLEVEDHGRVYQMITHVKGVVDPHQPGYAVRHMSHSKSSSMSVHGLTALQRCLPPGSMTGAPKERSCMHLQTIEARKRGIYSGVMGYLDLGGGGSFSVLIRTTFSNYSDTDFMENRQQTWRIGAGGAVTALSTAEGEWQEMLTKLRTVCNVFRPSDSLEGSGR